MKLKLAGTLAMVALLAACSDDKPAGGTTDDGSQFTRPAGNGQANGVQPGTEQDLVQNVGDRVLFTTDRSDLTPDDRAVLDRQAQWLKKYGNLSVTIEGHCDERGTREFNLALGERRAEAVRKYLVASGIDSSRVQTISYGKERPAVVGSDESAWSQNRRGVTVVN